jgi:aspartyl-tRNA(Asn)/glutamyl-tRNA(Gln) amidotransferase subunit B
MSYRGYDAVIGIETHVQLKTQSKIFSSDSTNFNASDNENTSPVTVGMPGTLPVINKKAIEYSIKTGLALNCTIRKKSVFARKNYFYPDLPKGYQISQYDQPLCENGQLTFMVEGKERKVSITRAHMEEDAGKSTHHGDYTLINLNRAGIPLLEIVSGPEMTSGIEASEYGRAIRQIVRYLNICDGNLEEGSMRCDVNISVKKIGIQKLGTKVEIKNINSFRFIEKAVEYEIDRQIDALEAGEKIIQETRLYDPDKNRTFSMRTKEDAQDYRYFPDPDLLPIVLSDHYIEGIKTSLPEMPLERARRLTAEQGLPQYDALVLTSEKEFADYYELAAQFSGNFKSTSNWVMTEVMRELNAHNLKIDESPVKPEGLGQLIKMIDEQKISGKIAKTVFAEMWKSGEGPEKIVKDKGMVQITDPSAIEKVVDEVLNANPSQVQDYKNGKVKVFGFFIGAVMKSSKGQANPDLVNSILLEKLKK